MKKKTTQIIFFSIAGLLIAVGGIFALTALENKPAPLDGFAHCLKARGAVFYGAFWCPHCQNQKEMFGRSEKYLPYVECSTKDGKSQLPECTKKNIKEYPLWEFLDGSREPGELSLEKLASKTGCQLP